VVRMYKVFHVASRDYSIDEAEEYDVAEVKAVRRLLEELSDFNVKQPNICGTVLLWCFYEGSSGLESEESELIVYVLKELCDEMKLGIEDVRKVVEEPSRVYDTFEVLTALRKHVLSKVPELYRRYGVTKLYVDSGACEIEVGTRFLVLMLF